MNLSQMNDEQYGLLFDVRRSIRYHDRRRAFFERLHTITSVMTILLAGSVLYDFGKPGESAHWLLAMGVIAAVLSTFDMAVGYSRRADQHHGLKKRFIDLEESIITGAGTDEVWDGYKKKRLSIERDEPPIYRALDLLCHNEVAVADGHGDEHISRLSTMQRVTCQLLHWSDIAHV